MRNASAGHASTCGHSFVGDSPSFPAFVVALTRACPRFPPRSWMGRRRSRVRAVRCSGDSPQGGLSVREAFSGSRGWLFARIAARREARRADPMLTLSAWRNVRRSPRLATK
jgi:hypothetical protein